MESCWYQLALAQLLAHIVDCESQGSLWWSPNRKFDWNVQEDDYWTIGLKIGSRTYSLGLVMEKGLLKQLVGLQVGEPVGYQVDPIGP